MDALRFAILGLGAGAVYALAAQGIVLVYRASGVLNFASGAMGMVCAFYFYDARESGQSTTAAMLGALGIAAAIGVSTHLLVMRPLRRAPALSRLIATLGIFTVLFAFGQRRYGNAANIVEKLLPVDSVTLWDDINVGKDRLILLAVGFGLTILLTVVYRLTRFGLATTAVAESRRNTAAQGWSPDLLATVNWALGAMLAALAAILIVNLSGLQVIGLSLLVVPALAAALVGSFRSFALTFAGGLLVGILQSEVTYVQTRFGWLEDKLHVISFDGLGGSVPFLVIIVVLVVRGRALPLRGEAIERPPEVGTGRLRPEVLLPAVVIAAVVIATMLSTSLVEAAGTTATLAVILLSLVVVTGYTGQLSLAQFALAGTGAWIGARLIANYDIPFELAFVIGVAGAIPVGLIVGLPALRTRGVNLAVATLGLALLIESQVLNNLDRTGGVTGTEIGDLRLFGIDFNTFDHPERYTLLAFAALVALGVLVANLRRGRAGRRLIAVRSNERAAAALGISVFGAKLYAFGLGAAIAAAGGLLMAFRRPSVRFYPEFSIFQSIFSVVYAVIGGIGFVLGAVIGAVLAPQEFASKVFGTLFESETAVQIGLGVLLILVLIFVPNGLASLRLAAIPGVRRLLRAPAAEPLPEVGRPALAPRTLAADAVTVRFGGVVAVNGVSISVAPGEVVGLIGPNGAGKTTLIDAMTGFVRASAGRVTLDGTNVSRWNARRRAAAGVGRSFQTLELFETMTVRENLRTASDRRDPVAYLSDLFWPRRTPLGPGAAAAVREFGLTDALDRRPDELPYGTRRLVAIARAVAAGPSVLLLDEPAAGLDDRETAELGKLLRRLASEWNLAVLLVEHDVSLVLDSCDRIAVLDFGRKIAEGTPAEIRADEAVVAAYLGEPVERRPAVPAAAAVRREGPLLEARGLSAGYGDLAAVRDLDLEVRPGEVVALLGPNGAGKTTTLLTLAGELPPLAGEVVWLGQTRSRPLHRRVRQGLAFVPEDRGVTMSLSAGANLRLGPGDRDQALDLFPELKPLLRRRTGLCSGGEQQILSLARALARDPKVLLADELSLGLAPLVVRRLLEAVRAAADRGVGVLLVEQHARDALDLADRVYVLRRGRVEVQGTGAEVLGRLDELEDAYLVGIPSD
jgi:ABC-type branched-subunit amino acid transport system ATPase component/branched-subunit amino acid ABC-type transport system permease component